MKIHTIQTGKTQITQNWLIGRGPDKLRFVYTLFDRRTTDWLPIYTWVIEHPEGLIVVDTGIPTNANAPIYFPPYMRLVQRAARFDMTPDQEIGLQMRRRGLSPDDVRWVVLTHLHQDHEGGLHHFPQAEFVVSRKEWEAAQGFKGRLAGYLNNRWPNWFSPKLINFSEARIAPFSGSFTLTQRGDVHLVPTPGHSTGHQSVIVEAGEQAIFFAGDASYTQELLIADTVDGVGPDSAAQHDTHKRILQFAARMPTIYLPSHDPDAERRLRDKTPIQKYSEVELLRF